ncbi:MAG: AAA family ATPase [Cellulosilyticaceae bacterium]
MHLAPITILYGGNGSGKTTALNVMAQKLQIARVAPYNKSSFFEEYLEICDFELCDELPSHSQIITSDDVFDYMLNMRMMNEGIDQKREELFVDYLDTKYAGFKMQSLEDYDQLKKVNQTRRHTQSMYVKKNLVKNMREYSNGESAFKYFTEKILDNGLYLLDEPENSLSPQKQMELVQFITDSARYFGCQFVISTHSPFLLAIDGAKIYDLDTAPVGTKKWTEVPNVRAYYEFFKKHQHVFEEE